MVVTTGQKRKLFNCVESRKHGRFCRRLRRSVTSAVKHRRSNEAREEGTLVDADFGTREGSRDDGAREKRREERGKLNDGMEMASFLFPSR